mgnify:CR=1 FL=1
MAQRSENFVFRGDYDFTIPTASTAIAAGDAVMDLNGRLSVMTADIDGYEKFCGFSDDVWSARKAIELYGASSTDFATPTTRPHKIKVYKSGVFYLAMRDVAGTKGQAVYLIDSTTGAQIFSVDLITGEDGGPIGYLYETFTGAVANDVQKVRIVVGEKVVAPDIRHYLMNHILHIHLDGSLTNNITSAPSDSYAITCRHMWAMVGGKFVSVPSYTVGTMSGMGTLGTESGLTGHFAVIYALGTDGSISAYFDWAKRSNTVSGVFRSNSFFWPSVTLDKLIIGVGVLFGSHTYITGPINWVFRSVADCLKVT